MWVRLFGCKRISMYKKARNTNQLKIYQKWKVEINFKINILLLWMCALGCKPAKLYSFAKLPYGRIPAQNNNLGTIELAASVVT
jgi:hypothetical protein